jgi:squalene monooxygenase
MSTGEFDIIVIGAGVAGGVFAASQPSGTRILVIERDLTEPDRIIGELMQPGGIQALTQMGLGHLLEGIDAQEVNGYNLIKGNERFTIHYDEVQKGIKGIGLRNGKFLTNIRQELAKRENITVVEGNVTQILEKDNTIIGVTYTQEDGTPVSQYAKLTIVCDGPMSVLRDKLSKVNKQVTSYFMGLVIKDLELEFPSYGHMIVTGDFPVLVYPIHTNAYRILIDYPGGKAPKMGKESIERLKESVVKVLPQEMIASFLKALEEDQLKVMPNHSMKNQAFRMKGAVLLGDSLNMRHPLTGGGMTATFSDILCLNEQLAGIDFRDETKLENAVNTYYNSRGKNVETINILANALYRVFTDDELKEACFEYLQKGGEQATGPLSILSGINRNKQFLLKHFFKVAMQHPIHFITKPAKQIRLYKNASRIIRPILKDEGVSAMI